MKQGTYIAISMRRWLTILTVVSVGAWAACVRADDASPWLSGPGLEQKLAAPLSIVWQGVPLWQALGNLSRTHRVAIVLDRRVDPDQTVHLAIDNLPLAEVFERIAEHLNLGYCQFGPVAYIGPPATARQVRTLAALRLEEARRLPAGAQQKLLTARKWHWDELAEPRQLVGQLAAEAGVRLAGADRIPHDLWPQTDLPPLAWIDRLSLVAAQFGLTCHLADNGRTVELVPVPADARLARTYPGGPNAQAVAQRWAGDLPDAAIKMDNGQIRVLARLEDHEWIEARMRGPGERKTTVPAGKQVYTLTAEDAALDKLVAQLAQRLHLDFRWDRAATEAAGIESNQLVSISVEQADLDELLRAVFAKTGLEFHRQGQTVVVQPAR